MTHFFAHKRSIIGMVIVPTIISSVLCTLGFSPTIRPMDSVATIWPGAITQSFVSIIFGGWGIVSTLLSGIIVNATNLGNTSIAVAFILPNFIQSFIPAYYYRKRIGRDGWSDQIFAFKPFLIYAVLVPNLIGSVMASWLTFYVEGVPFTHSLIRWLIANVPISLILGWPLLRTLGPVLVEEKWVVTKWWK